MVFIANKCNISHIVPLIYFMDSLLHLVARVLNLYSTLHYTVFYHLMYILASNSNEVM